MKFKLLFALTFFSLSSFSIADPGVVLSPTVVTATRVEENSFDLPVSIDVVDQNAIQFAQPEQSLAESLIRVPGISAQNRNQMAQDTGIQTRGFGARSAFGVRGIRMYVDGISMTNPDGIANPGNIDLSNLKSIEIMRGPFSALYGSSSGGVIQLRTQDAPLAPEIITDFKAGSYGTTEESLKITGTEKGVQYLFDTGAYNTEGYRDHSAIHKDQTTAKFKFTTENDTKVTVLADYMNLSAQDPLGLKSTSKVGALSEYSVFSNPTQAPTVALVDNTRVHKENTQIGIIIEHEINENNSINFINSVGHRINDQFSSKVPTSNASKESLIGRDFFNDELNWENRGLFLDHIYSLTSGISYGSLRDNRCDTPGNGTSIQYGCNSPSGQTKFEKDYASNLDEFIQGKWTVLENVDLHAGIRNTNVNYNVQSMLSSSPSGGLHFSKATPVSGVVWKINPSLNIYANYGQGFETPTLAEIAYKSSDGSGGPNLSLKPMTSDNYEIGIKSYLSSNTRSTVAIFRTNTTNEIIISNSSTSAYTVYANAGSTMRQGLELSIDSALEHNISLYGAYTYLDAQFTSTYSTTTSDPTVYGCPTSCSYKTAAVNSGNRIPGTYRQQLYGEIAWKYPELNFNTAFEGRYNSKVFVSDTNIDTSNGGSWSGVYAPTYTIFNLRAGFDQNLSNWKIKEYARIENIFDKQYISAVRVNDGNGRFFEAGQGRNYLVGLTVKYNF